MGSSNPKRRTCRHCGAPMGMGEYVEIRVLDRIPERVETAGGAYTRWTAKTMMTEYVCVPCAVEAVDRIEQGRKQR